MTIHKYIKRGLNHANYCEDFILHETLADKYELFAVFDGCSSGIDSHFASAFIAKIVRTEFQKLQSETELLNKKCLEKLLFNVILSLKEQKQILNLDSDELLSTIILFLYNKLADSGIIIIVGDGLVSINGELTNVDQNNIPDYLAYHLDKINSEDDFKIWYMLHAREFCIDKLLDVSISTDGTTSFTQTGILEENEVKIDPLDYLFKDEFLLKNKAMIGRKCNMLERKHGLVNTDDLGIIRIIKM